MIIRNEKDRLKAMRLLEDAEFPCEIHIYVNIIYDAGHTYGDEIEYPDTPEPELGSHNSGMEAEEYW